jgi:hypothetical protein
VSDWDALPGFVEERTQVGETTVVVEPAELLSAAATLRDEHGFNFLSDITAVDYLGWAGAGVSGYLGTASGRDRDGRLVAEEGRLDDAVGIALAQLGRDQLEARRVRHPRSPRCRGRRTACASPCRGCSGSPCAA